MVLAEAAVVELLLPVGPRPADRQMLMSASTCAAEPKGLSPLDEDNKEVEVKSKKVRI